MIRLKYFQNKKVSNYINMLISKVVRLLGILFSSISVHFEMVYNLQHTKKKTVWTNALELKLKKKNKFAARLQKKRKFHYV